jgi:peptide-methionine (R)-S-oxide reductase
MALQLSEAEWKAKLTPEQYQVLREKGTERPGSGKYLYNDDKGDYRCAACNALLFHSDTKYESTTPGLVGWPSFSEAADSDAVDLVDDDRHGMHRTEVICKNCGSHLGHLFPDESSPNGKHFCINSAALEFEEKS